MKSHYHRVFCRLFSFSKTKLNEGGTKLYKLNVYLARQEKFLERHRPTLGWLENEGCQPHFLKHKLFPSLMEKSYAILLLVLPLMWWKIPECIKIHPPRDEGDSSEPFFSGGWCWSTFSREEQSRTVKKKGEEEWFFPPLLLSCFRKLRCFCGLSRRVLFVSVSASGSTCRLIHRKGKLCVVWGVGKFYFLNPLLSHHFHMYFVGEISLSCCVFLFPV